MKKIVSLLVGLLLICTAAYAEAPDLAAMSLEELVQLHNAVDAEIDARIGCEPSTIPAGIYVGGESMKAGSYTISTNDEHYGINVATFESMELYEQAMAEENESLILFQNYLSKGDSAFVQIKDGMVLLVSSTAIFETAKADWMM